MDNHQFLKNSQQEVEQIIKMATAFKNLPKTTLFQKPTAEKWNIAECLEHLNIYARYYIPTMEQRLEKALLKGKKMGNHLVKHNWIDNMSIKSIHPDNRKVKPIKTMKKFNPIHKTIEGDPLGEFLNHQNHLLKVIQKMEHVNLNKTKVPVEFFKLLRLTLAGTLEFVIRHEQRHLLQAEDALLMINS